MENSQIFSLADQLKAAKELKKEVDAQAKEIGAEIEKLDLALSDAMAEAECDRFSHNGSTFYLSNRLFVSPAAGCRDEMISALKAHGYADIVTETVNANTLASFIKEQIALNNDAIPNWLADVVNTYEKTSVGMRRS